MTATLLRSASRTGSPAGGRTYLDPAALMRIKNLELRARVVVEGFLSGLHASPYHGFSVEFTEYRQYSPGDDLRYLDWRLYARSDRYYLKRFEDETNLRCYLLVDLSRSMSFGSLEYDKASYAKTAAATIAYFLSLQRDAVGVVTFDEQLREYLPPRFRPGHMHRLMMCLEHSTGGKATDLAAPLEQIAKTSRKRGMVVLLSDLLAPVETLETRLGYLRSQGHDVVILRVLDPADISFPFKEAALFHDLENDRELYIEPDAMRAKYQQRFAAHKQSLTTAFARLGIDSFELTTDQPLERVLMDILSVRMRRGKATRRAGQARRHGGGS